MIHPRAPRRRWRWLVLAAFLLIAAIASVPLWFDATRVAAVALSLAGKATGLELGSRGEAELRWRPTPWLAIPDFEMRDSEGTLLLRAERLEIALPWATLRGKALEVEDLLLEAPLLDAQALAHWLASRPAAEPSPLPRLDRLAVRRGALRYADHALYDADIVLSNFGPGQRFRLDANGRVLLASGRRHGRLGLVATAEGDSVALLLRELELELDGDDPLPVLRAQGDWQRSPGWRLALDGRLEGWRAGWGRLPPPLADVVGPIDFHLVQQGETALQAPARLQVRSGTAQATATAVPAELLAWLEGDDRPLLPPLHGSASLPRLTLDGVRMEGLMLEIDETPASTP